MGLFALLCILSSRFSTIPTLLFLLTNSKLNLSLKKLFFLQKFLEGYSMLVGYSDEADPLETRIADAAHAAEDLIESHIVDKIHGEEISCIDLYQSLHEVIEDLDSIKKETTKMKEKTRIEDLQLFRNSSISGGSLRSRSISPSTMVGLDAVLYDALEMLVRGQPNRRIIPIVGMGGMGKTTLARHIYEKKVVVEHFVIRVWLTISQVYSMREILLKVLEEIEGYKSQMNEQLGEKIHKHLWGRRYLIIMDDIWDIQVWDQLNIFFPDNHNGSRIILTTRLDTLSSQLANSSYIRLGFLHEGDSWNLFGKCVFGEDDCPPELEGIGKQIAEGCRGLPLSIVVVGGLLAKSEKTRQHWEYIAENLNSVVNLEDNERCLQVLYLSYKNLPVYLKPCFLYMGVFPEDRGISTTDLYKLWVAEGFLKPIDGKSLEEVAQEYLEELVGRNLIIGCTERLCMIHDLLRDLCLRESRKQKFLCVLDEHSLAIPQDLSTERRICIHQHRSKEEYPPQFLEALESASSVRSFIWYSEEPNYIPSLGSRLSRVFLVMNECDHAGLEAILQQVNLRYIFVGLYLDHNATSHLSMFPSSVSLLWNLQTLFILNISLVYVPSEIWKIPQLRHVMFTNLVLPDPPSDLVDMVLENLQTLSYIRNFRCSEEVVKRIPNITKLEVWYLEEHSESLHSLNNLSRLQKLESLLLRVYCCSEPENMRNHLLQGLMFPHSLKKLTLLSTHLHWKDLATTIGSLPLLEVLQLGDDAVIGPEWETIEGQFCSLRILDIKHCDLECWTTDNTHFPLLQHLILRGVKKLGEIPSSIGDIPTLQLITLGDCGDCVVDSAERLRDEQRELGNEDLRLLIYSNYKNRGGFIVTRIADLECGIEIDSSNRYCRWFQYKQLREGVVSL